MPPFIVAPSSAKTDRKIRSLHLLQELPRFAHQGLNLPSLGDRVPGEQAVLARVLVALGAPDPGAPPCMRQRFLPRTAGERHKPPERILAPQRGLASIGPVLRA
jgi:hypothetical protein